MAKRFFYTALGILALAGAHHLGAKTTDAQSGIQFTGIATSTFGTHVNTIALAGNGDVYGRSGSAICSGSAMLWTDPSCDWQLMGNVASGPVSTDAQSFGAIKGAFRK